MPGDRVKPSSHVDSWSFTPFDWTETSEYVIAEIFDREVA
jgi:hypothetical protein